MQIRDCRSHNQWMSNWQSPQLFLSSKPLVLQMNKWRSRLGNALSKVAKQISSRNKTMYFLMIIIYQMLGAVLTHHNPQKPPTSGLRPEGLNQECASKPFEELFQSTHPWVPVLFILSKCPSVILVYLSQLLQKMQLAQFSASNRSWKKILRNTAPLPAPGLSEQKEYRLWKLKTKTQFESRLPWFLVLWPWAHY